MNWLTRKNPETPATAIPAESLESMLAEMQRSGKPVLGMYGDDGTWSCKVCMHVAAVGAEFTVRSDYKHLSPMDAAAECLERMRAVLAKAGQP